jgi:hypothetical protein
MAPHPRVYTRHSLPPTAAARLGVMVHAASEHRATWVAKELGRLDALIQFGRTIEAVVLALIDDPPPRPQVLVVDFDAIAAVEVLQLHEIREHGWCGRIIGLGVVPPPLRASLGIERVINTPFDADSLCDAVAEIGFDAMTMRIPVVLDEPCEALELRSRHAKVAVARTRSR